MNICALVSRVRSHARVGLCALMLTACATAPNERQDALNDPLEPFNRAVFSFNEVVDGYVLKPVAKGYVAIVPEYGRERVHNVLTNLRMPLVFLNSTLQGDPQNALSALWYFILNTTIGVVGIFDFAGTNTDLVVRDEDFDQTLGVHGAGTGPYIVLPIIGPSSGRHVVGRVVDWLTDPFNYTEDEVVITRTVASAIDTRANSLKTLDEIYRTSFDPYATIRSGYFQRRAALVENRNGFLDGENTGPLDLPAEVRSDKKAAAEGALQ